MLKRSFLLIGLFAIAWALVEAGPASAQPFGVGGRMPGSYGWGANPFILTPSGGGGFNGFYPGGGYGYSPYGNSGYGMGYNPYGYSGNGSPGLYYYGNSIPLTNSYSYSALSSSLPAVSSYSAAYPPAFSNMYINSKINGPSAKYTVVNVKVPNAEADVWFGDHKTKQIGLTREFVTPDLQVGKKFKYHVRAVWTENGKPVERKETINFAPGQTVTVDFTQPEMSEKNAKTAGTEKKEEKK